MSEGLSVRKAAPYVITAALFLVVGIDVGLRLGARGGPPAGPAAAPATKQATAPQGTSATPAPASTTVIIVRGAAPGSDRDHEPDPAPAAPPAPDPIQQASKALVEKWAAAPDGRPTFATREAEPPMPLAEGKFAELRAAAEGAASKGDKQAALKLYEEAEAAAGDPRYKEEMRLRRLWISFEIGDAKEVRRLAEAIGARPVRADSRKIASEVLVKLDSKK